MSINRRLEALEQAARPKGEGLLVVWQDNDNPELFRESSGWGQGGDQGAVYTPDDLARLDGQYETIFKVVYVDDWRENERAK